MESVHTIRRYLPTILALLSTFIVVQYQVEDLLSNEWFAGDFIDTVFSYGLGLLIAIPTIIYSLRQLKKSKSIIHKAPLFIICFGALVIVGLLIIGNFENRSSVIFSANYDGDLNGINLKLRQDGSYRIESYNIFGGEFFEGSFKIIGDTILLSNLMPLGASNDFMTEKLIVKADKVLFNLDKNGNYETDYYTMRVLENKLKK